MKSTTHTQQENRIGIRKAVIVLAGIVVLGLLLTWFLLRDTSEPELSEGVDTICEIVGYTAYQGEHDMADLKLYFGLANSIRHRAEEIVCQDFIYR